MTTATNGNVQHKLLQQFRNARRVSTPIVSISTPDPAATMRLICGGTDDAPKISWDVVRGYVGLNESGENVLTQNPGMENATKNNPLGGLTSAQELPGGVILFFQNYQLYTNAPAVVQATWNLRDTYKTNQRMIVLLGPEIKLPEALAQGDVVQFEDPLPNAEQLQAVVQRMFDATPADQIEYDLTEELRDRTAQALLGTSAFAAEQLTAMAIKKSSVDADSLDTAAKKLIEQTPGLTFETGTENFSDIGGMDFIKGFANKLASGPNRPAVIVRIEELEKAMAGSAGDLSGTSGDALQVLLSEMEDNEWSGILAYGAPGAGKSLFAKSMANSGGAKPIRFDINATKGSLVGQSEANIRKAMRVIKTIGGKRVFFVASVNQLDKLPPELQRRFKCGVWFFDAPTDADQKKVWEINRKRYNITEAPIKEKGLTGADIRNICEMANSLECSLTEARGYVVPLKVQSPKALGEARRNANNRFIDASKGGVYQAPNQDKPRRQPTGDRKISMDN